MMDGGRQRLLGRTEDQVWYQAIIFKTSNQWILIWDLGICSVLLDLFCDRRYMGMEIV